jgi:hypothetical protein
VEAGDPQREVPDPISERHVKSSRYLHDTETRELETAFAAAVTVARRQPTVLRRMVGAYLHLRTGFAVAMSRRTVADGSASPYRARSERCMSLTSTPVASSLGCWAAQIALAASDTPTHAEGFSLIIRR